MGRSLPEHGGVWAWEVLRRREDNRPSRPDMSRPPSRSASRRKPISRQALGRSSPPGPRLSPCSAGGLGDRVGQDRPRGPCAALTGVFRRGAALVWLAGRDTGVTGGMGLDMIQEKLAFAGCWDAGPRA